MTREALVNQAVKLFEKHTSVALLWATGVGKSAAAIKMANKYIGKTKNKNVLLVVAEVAHKENWQKEFEKWGMINATLTIECYASLHKYRNTNWDLIIFDEAHHLGSDLRLEVLSSMRSNKNILLSATLDRGMLNELENILGYIAPHKISLQDAIDFNILPGPHIHLIPLTLDNVKTDQWIVEEWGDESKRIPIYTDLRDKWKYLRNKKQYPNIKLCMRCTALQKYNYLTEQTEYWKKKYMSCRQEYMKNKWMQIGIQRKRFLGEVKTHIVKRLIEKLKDKRYICFCASVAQAEYLGKENAIHSKVKKAQSIIDSFNEKKIDNLYAVGMLQEGQNLVDIEAGIIIQLDGSERPFIQKFGRSLRASDPHQYIFYYKNNRDEEYLNNILEDFNSDYINVLDVKKL
jgi:superfamily II DNA or RNA helicase